MYFTISQTSAFEMGHWMVLSLFIFIFSSGELKANSLAGTKKLRDAGSVFSKGKIEINFGMNSVQKMDKRNSFCSRLAIALK